MPLLLWGESKLSQALYREHGLDFIPINMFVYKKSENSFSEMDSKVCFGAEKVEIELKGKWQNAFFILFHFLTIYLKTVSVFWSGPDCFFIINCWVFAAATFAPTTLVLKCSRLKVMRPPHVAFLTSSLSTISYNYVFYKFLSFVHI